MKALQITYERLFNLGNYSHEKISVTLEIEQGEKANDVLQKAKQFVEAQNNDKNGKNFSGFFFTLERATKVIENKNNYNYAEVIAAHEAINYFKSQDKDDLPF